MYVDIGDITVQDLMDTSPETVGRSASVAEVITRMKHAGVRHVPVLALGRTVVGMVSLNELVRLGVSPFGPKLSETRLAVLQATPVTEVMVKVVETIEPEHKAATAASRLKLLSQGCLPVVEGNRLVGMISEETFVAWFASQAM